MLRIMANSMQCLDGSDEYALPVEVSRYADASHLAAALDLQWRIPFCPLLQEIVRDLPLSTVLDLQWRI